MKKYIVKYMYFNGNSKHLGVAIVFTDDEEKCKEMISEKIKKTYENGYLIKLSNNIQECTEDVFIIK